MPKEKLRENKGKNCYDMKNIDDIKELFHSYWLSDQELIEFRNLALKDNRKSLNHLGKFDNILESPFISLLLKDTITLKAISI